MAEQKTVLIVAADLGFVFWVGQTLGNHGFQAVPATSVASANKLLHEFHLQVDVLIVDPALDGAVRLAETLHRAPHHARVIAVGHEGEYRLPIVDVWKEKPPKSSSPAVDSWIQAVESQAVGAR